MLQISRAKASSQPPTDTVSVQGLTSAQARLFTFTVPLWQGKCDTLLINTKICNNILNNSSYKLYIKYFIFCIFLIFIQNDLPIFISTISLQLHLWIIIIIILNNHSKLTQSRPFVTKYQILL